MFDDVCTCQRKLQTLWEGAWVAGVFLTPEEQEERASFQITGSVDASLGKNSEPHDGSAD